MGLFKRKEKKPDSLFRVNERCGVLIKSSKKGYLWVISPFWDITDPVILHAPEQKIDAIIILNNRIEGCLPLSSLFAANKNLASENIYVTNKNNPHDWHPNYTKTGAINDLINVSLLPELLAIGSLTVTYANPNDFIKIKWKNYDTGESLESLIGNNLFQEDSPNDERLAGKSYHFIGNFDPDKLLETANFITNVAIQLGPEQLFVALMPEWIQSNPESVIYAFNQMGITVHSVGKGPKANDA